ncbi:MAG: UDP-3-O-acyl-N-acetylglucosamine deacetylase, partial [Candidatus Omnitrophota bacterium]
AGLGQGATLENTLVMGEDGPVGTTLRFPDEPVRHKILDLVGDFYLLGRPVLCRVVAERSGHRLNAMMAKRIYEKYIRKGACL